MIAKKIIAAALLTLTGAVAFAADYPADGESYMQFPTANPQTQLSHKTRAEVRAELIQARLNGELDYDDASYPSPSKTALPSKLTRAEVRAAYIQARQNGLIVEGEAYPFPSERVQPTSVSESEVRAEAMQSEN